MGKNDTLEHTLRTSGSVMRDENFKDVVRFKAIAALIVKFAIPEYRDMTLEEIARLIIDSNRKRRTDMSKTAILEDEVDFLPSEAGTKDEKNTISDAVFRVALGDKAIGIRLKSLDSEITVNAEMQNTVSEGTLKYSLVSRAIYYGATLLRDTVPAGDTNYTNIHKVYTIWFCANNLNLQMYDEIRGMYIHRYGIRRFYEGIEKVVKPEKESDLIEAVLIELKKLRKEDNQTDYLIHELFYNTGNLVNSIETTEKVNLTKVKKGVKDMIDYEARLREHDAWFKEEVREELREEVKEEVKAETELDTEVKLAQRLMENLRNGKDISYSILIRKAASTLELSEATVRKLEEIYNTIT